MMRTLLIFGKLPVKGLVKTRLINEFLTEDVVTTLYECFLLDTLNLISKVTCNRIYWFIYPHDLTFAQNLIEKSSALLEEKIVVKKQKGKDFGERFTNAFKMFESLEPQNLVVIGTDVPQLQSKTIGKAFELLESEECVVIGPSPEGGFYLLGISNSIHVESRNFFDNSLEVLNYLDYFEEKKIPLYLVEEVSDIDTFPDLISLYSLLKLRKYASQFEDYNFPNITYNYLEQLDLRKAYEKAKRRLSLR